MNGFVILNKEEGVSSFKAASLLRRIYGEKKIGHTGTLDPMATGVLPVALGKATRFIDFLPQSGKSYVAGFRFGLTTDTLDITGRVLSEREAHISSDDVRAVLGEFTGDIMQVPPMFSALSQNGTRLYTLARQGVEVEREARKVSISSIELLTCADNGDFRIAVDCSKGTYIRSLVADIGDRLGSGAVLTSLCRTRANGFTYSQARTASQLEEAPLQALLGIDTAFMCYPPVKVTSAQQKRFLNGGELFSERLHSLAGVSVYRVYSPDGVFLGLGEITGESPELLKVKRVVSDGK